jgi:type III pantothenate kinase
MPIRYDDPREVGPDRIANAVAVRERYGTPSIVVDFGTSTNFDIVSAGGEYVGGVLAPGIEISMDALFARAARLFKVDFVEPPSVIGKTTASGLQSGLVYGFAGQVDAIVDRIRGELGADAPAIATGGLADLIVPHARTIERVDPFLTLEGLRLVWERNK